MMDKLEQLDIYISNIWAMTEVRRGEKWLWLNLFGLALLLILKFIVNGLIGIGRLILLLKEKYND